MLVNSYDYDKVHGDIDTIVGILQSTPMIISCDFMAIS